jgi:hypothetical protein
MLLKHTVKRIFPLHEVKDGTHRQSSAVYETLFFEWKIKKPGISTGQLHCIRSLLCLHKSLSNFDEDGSQLVISLPPVSLFVLIPGMLPVGGINSVSFLQRLTPTTI